MVEKVPTYERHLTTLLLLRDLKQLVPCHFPMLLLLWDLKQLVPWWDQSCRLEHSRNTGTLQTSHRCREIQVGATVVDRAIRTGTSQCQVPRYHAQRYAPDRRRTRR